MGCAWPSPCKRPRAMRSLACFLIAATTAACSDGRVGSGGPADEDTAEGKADGFGAGGAAPTGFTIPLRIAHGAFDAVGDRPNVVVYIPTGFDPSQLNVVVFLHGWYNCATNVLGGANG